MRVLTYALLAGLATATALTLMPVRAAQSPATARIAPVTAELLVFETDNCAYCFVFRRDVAPDYQKSPRARDVPLRFIDAREADLSKINLNQPIRILPTVVLMRNGREVSRITGYMGPEPFFYMVSRLMK